MNTQNEEDIPTRNLKKTKKKQQKHPKLETDDFPRGTKNKKKKTKNNNPPQKKTSETPRKIFKCSRQTNFWKTKLDVNTKHVEFLSAKHYQHTFLLHNLQNKVTFFNFNSPYFYFGFCHHMVYLSHYLTKTPTTTRIPEDPPKKTHTTPLKYTATSVGHLLGS